MATALRTLLNGMSENSYKLISDSANIGQNRTARTKANFDFNGSTWTNDAAVGGNPMGGVGAIGANNWNWSAPAISPDDGKLTFPAGGGHTDSGDGSILTFDTEAAAASINGGGAGGVWALAQPSTRYIDAFTNSRPSSAISPTGAQQDGPTTLTGTNQGYWAMPNINGVAMPLSSHLYHTAKYIPGTRKVIISSGSGFAQSAGHNTNACFVFDDSDNSVTGPLVATMFGTQTNTYGYALETGSGSGAVAVNPRDGTVYATYFWPGIQYSLARWTDPTTSSIAVDDIGAGDIGAIPGSTNDAIIFPDPSDPAKDLFFIHNPNNIGDTHFDVWTDIGGSPVGNRCIYSGSAPATSGGSAIYHYAWDSTRGVIWMSDGANLYKITPTGSSNLTTWTISAAITGSTGDTPPASAGGAQVPAIAYVANDDCIIHGFMGDVRVYKPTGWSPLVVAPPHQLTTMGMG
jgi:hypothetical protein